MQPNDPEGSGKPQNSLWEKVIASVDKIGELLDKLGTLFERIDKVLLRGIATAITFSAIIDVIIILTQHIQKTIA